MNKLERQRYDKQWRLNNKEKISKQGKQYYIKNKEKIILKRKKYYIKNKEKIDIRTKKYSQTINGKLSSQKRVKKYRNDNPEKKKAHSFINNLLQNSNFTRDICSICGKPNAEFHHENYDLPNFGYWFCKEHHNEIHREWL